MSNRDPDARYERSEQSIPWMIQQWVRLNVHTCGLGLVREYDPASKRARVQPALRTIFNDGSPPADKPPILDIPLRQPGTGGYLMHQEIAAGDVALLLFSQRGIEAFKAQWGEISDPGKGCYFAMRDALAIPWGREDIEPVRSTGWIVQGADGAAYLSLDGDTIRIITGESMVIARPASIRLERGGGSIEITDGGIRIAGNVTMDDNLRVNGSSLSHRGTNVGQDHTHTRVQSGSSRSGPP